MLYSAMVYIYIYIYILYIRNNLTNNKANDGEKVNLFI